MRRVKGLIFSIPKGLGTAIKMNIEFIKEQKTIHQKIICIVKFVLNMLIYPLLIMGSIMVAIFQPKIYDQGIKELKERFGSER